MLGRLSPGSPDTDPRKRNLSCVHCPKGCDMPTSNERGSMRWQPPEDGVDAPEWTWLIGRPV